MWVLFYMKCKNGISCQHLKMEHLHVRICISSLLEELDGLLSRARVGAYPGRSQGLPLPPHALCVYFCSFILLCCFLGFRRFDLAGPGLRETDKEKSKGMQSCTLSSPGRAESGFEG